MKNIVTIIQSCFGKTRNFFAPGPLHFLRQRISRWPIKTPAQAHQVAGLIPAQCPFERDIVIWGHQVAHLPPLCKLNPLYDELVELRFRALCYLADECGEDISVYI